METIDTQPAAAYTAPTLVIIGSVEALTQGNKSGSFTDQVFPVHTPKAAITFS